MLELLLTFAFVLASGVVPEDLPSEAALAPAAPVIRTEHFSLRGIPLVTEEGAPPLGVDKGVMALRRVDTAGGRLYEREVTFSTGGIRVHHTEEIIGTDRRLVWREFRPYGARTWVAEWNTETGKSRTTGYGWKRGAHGRLGWSPEANKPACGPLELMDRMRDGRLSAGVKLAVVEPAAAALSDVEICREGGLLRARRADGSIVCVCPVPVLIADAEPGAAASAKGVSFSAGTILVPLLKEGYARARKRWFVPTRPAHESMLARIPRRR